MQLGHLFLKCITFLMLYCLFTVVGLGMMFLPLAVMDKKISTFSCILHLSLSGSTTGIPDILINSKGTFL